MWRHIGSRRRQNVTLDTWAVDGFTDGMPGGVEAAPEPIESDPEFAKLKSSDLYSPHSGRGRWTVAAQNIEIWFPSHANSAGPARSTFSQEGRSKQVGSIPQGTRIDFSQCLSTRRARAGSAGSVEISLVGP